MDRKLEIGDIVKIKNLSNKKCINFYNFNLFVITELFIDYVRIHHLNYNHCLCSDCLYYIYNDVIFNEYLELIQSKIEIDRSKKLKICLRD